MDTSKMKNSMASFRNKMNSSRGSGSSFGAINGSSENASQSTASPSEEAGVMPAEDETTQSPAQSTPASPRNQPGGRKPKLDIKEIDRITGGIVDEYKCVHSNFNGTLYGGPSALIFLGQIFFFNWTLVVQWQDVISIHKTTRGVAVKVKSPKIQLHEFEVETLADQAKAWDFLLRLHNDSVVGTSTDDGTPSAAEEAPTDTSVKTARRSLRRRNSDPLRMSQDMGALGFAAAIKEVKDDSAVLPTGKSNSEIEISHSATKRRESITRVASAPLEHGEPESLSKVKENKPPTPSETDVPSAAQQQKPKVDKKLLEKQWSDLSPKSAFSETAIENYELPCSLQDFISNYIDDDAKHSISGYMEQNGDAEVNTTNWTPAKEGISHTRTIRYTHPVNAPMAPPMARARKEQTLSKYDVHGITLETRTIVDDVPMTDCFYVADMLRVEAIDDNKVKISMHFDIKFVKGTMFKGIITRTTKKEFEQFMQGMAKYMSASIGDDKEAQPQQGKEAKIEVPPEPQRPAEPSLSKTQLYVGLGCFALVVALQLWILNDLRFVKSEIRNMRMDVKFSGIASSQ